VPHSFFEFKVLPSGIKDGVDKSIGIKAFMVFFDFGC
jgi:hypothetical protein